MKKQIENPNRLNWKMYVMIIICLTALMVITVQWNDCVGSTVSGVFENLTLGALASALVALFIEIGNVNDKNIKSNSLYDAVYGGLKFQISQYVSAWANMCSDAYKDKDYKSEKHTWLEWYTLTKENFNSCDEEKKANLLDFFRRQLDYSLASLEKELNQINSQQYILTINDVSNNEMKQILGDFYFEFYNVKRTLDTKEAWSADEFWRLFDAIKEDIQGYIDNWIDIQFYNDLKFSPYKFLDDLPEMAEAIVKSNLRNGVKTIKKKPTLIPNSLIVLIFILILFILQPLKVKENIVVQTQRQGCNLVYSEESMHWLSDNSDKELDFERIIEAYRASCNGVERETIYDKKQDIVVSVEYLDDVYCIWSIQDNIKQLE